MSQDFAWPTGFTAGAAITFDVDAESAVLGENMSAAAHLSVMSHQSYGPAVGVPRLLKMLERLSMKATFFVPGFTAQRYPEVTRSIADEGHEIAAHGYMHEVPTRQSDQDHRETVLKGVDALEQVTGTRPRGYRAPMWSLSSSSPEILAEAGLVYDSSLMDDDRPYLLATPAGDLVEFPIYWGLDDWEPYAFIPEVTGSGSIEDPRALNERWYDEFDAIRGVSGLFVLTCHPFLSGRPARARALEGLLERVGAAQGVWTGTLGELADCVTDQELEPRSILPVLSPDEAQE